MGRSAALRRYRRGGLPRADFASFAQHCFHELNPFTLFASSWHHDIIAAKLDAVREGRIRRLIINEPPRHLKSHLASVSLPAWCLGHDPRAQILCVSYAQDLADKLSRDCRQIVASAWYRRLFATRLSAQRQAMSEFETTAQGCRLAASVDGVLTGRGADIIIIDDPLKPEEALSQTQRQAANDWFDHTLQPAKRHPHGGDHPDHASAARGRSRGPRAGQEDWEVVRSPAVAEENEVWALDSELGQYLFTRERCEALHPERQPLAILDHIRRTIGEYNFASQYQQMPSPQGGGMVKAAWISNYASDERPDGFDRIVQSWDTANKARELNDFRVCATWGIEDKDL